MVLISEATFKKKRAFMTQMSFWDKFCLLHGLLVLPIKSQMLLSSLSFTNATMRPRLIEIDVERAMRILVAQTLGAEVG